ncbi:uncharacterized protein DUF559 [Jatrophihabitans sp. GAS493]|uniref:DUF559 domain-containing protein n=1 Tax=Jatrophihabitans sp. GAS493 TaxID=1907575 RepID=UPI000BB86276|nr:DUF559 domain-containing protein [Jatrophihabitans sp. GAS493]SOD71605.1 uncharacterized protein DUF559 [Jatrophihabitans sp. GAS493]
MLTRSALRSVPDAYDETVQTPSDLYRQGWTRDSVRAQLQARRWQRIGRVVVQHNSLLTADERVRAVVLHHGPRCVATSFTAAEQHGLTGWHRDEVHVLVPRGARIRPLPEIAAVVHFVADWRRQQLSQTQLLHRPAPALIVAASGMRSPRHACAILAAAVQQRVTETDALHRSLAAAPTTRHHAVLAHAIDDIGQGTEALSEIDFLALCRRFRLPLPEHQAVRVDATGRRRYLDAEWVRRDGTRVIVEVDGAIHLNAQHWIADQLRQNALAISGSVILRFPSVVVRTEPRYVAAQLREALQLPA